MISSTDISQDLKIPQNVVLGYMAFLGICLRGVYPQDIKILGWCPAGPVFPHGEKVPV